MLTKEQSGKTELEDIMKTFMEERGVYQEFLLWLDDNYPSDLSGCGVDDEN